MHQQHGHSKDSTQQDQLADVVDHMHHYYVCVITVIVSDARRLKMTGTTIS
jgi:hypothetical protein